MSANDRPAEAHLAALDGWRGLSVLAILACHLLPLGPNAWGLNATAGPLGMALFFTLSGFLICRFLLHKPDVVEFLIRRFARIVPLAWAAMAIFLWWADADRDTWLANFLFYANLPPQQMTRAGSHLWSLCVEVQFYVAIAFVVAVAGRRGLYVLPLAALAITLHRIEMGATVDIVTTRRADEVLAGATLALVFEGRFGERARQALRHCRAWWLLPLLVLSSHPRLEALNYARPYIAAMLVGGSLVAAPALLHRVLASRVLGYVATTSYALYVIHHGLIYTWLGSGETLERYLKRPLLIALTFALAHASTFWYERRFMEWAKQLIAWRRARAGLRAPARQEAAE
jgi:peptidoglycan/LPS O-acetylase OafA/YrhL